MTRHLLMAALALGLATRGLAQTAVGTALTYQGELRQSGAPAAGPVDLRFRLYDAATAGVASGSSARRSVRANRNCGMRSRSSHLRIRSKSKLRGSRSF